MLSFTNNEHVYSHKTSTCMEAAISRHSVSAVVQNTDLREKLVIVP